MSDKAELTDDGATKATEAADENGNSVNTSRIRSCQCNQPGKLLPEAQEEDIVRQKNCTLILFFKH